MIELINQISAGITSGTSVLLVSTAIVIWALIAYLRFRSGMSPVVSAVNQAVVDISRHDGESGFVNGFHEFEERMQQNPIMCHAWNEFSETLIKDPLLEPAGIRNTRAASEHFSRNSVIGDRVNLRFYNALPNLLTGSGILGTFIGLVAGIWLAGRGLASSDTEVVKQALQQLLNGASLAFMTSIAGLISSILFSWHEKHVVHNLEAGIRKWNEALDSRLIRVTGESLATQQLAESRQQTIVLGQFTSELAFQIADAFQDRISASLGPTLERLVTAVEEMRTDQHKRNDDALQGMLEKFSSSLTSSAGRELSTLGETLATLNDKLEVQVSSLAKQQEDINNASTKSMNDMSRVFQWSLDQMKTGIKDALGEVEDTVSKLMSEMATVVDNATTLGKEFSQILENTGEVVTNLNDAANTVSSATEPMLESVSDIKSATYEIKNVADINGQIANQINESVSRIGVLQSDIKDSWSRYEERFDQVDASMAKTMRELVTGLETYTERVKVFIKGLDEHTSSIVKDLAGASSELSSAVEELGDTLTRVMK